MVKPHSAESFFATRRVTLRYRLAHYDFSRPAPSIVASASLMNLSASSSTNLLQCGSWSSCSCKRAAFARKACSVDVKPYRSRAISLMLNTVHKHSKFVNLALIFCAAKTANSTGDALAFGVELTGLTAVPQKGMHLLLTKVLTTSRRYQKHR